MNKDYDTEISQKQSELDSLKAQMEACRLQFVEDATDFVEKFYKETSEIRVKTGADITLNLEKDKLRQMKEKIIKLIEDVKEITNDTLSSKELWWHLEEFQRFGEVDAYFAYSYSGNAAPKILDKAIRLVLGKLGVIFKEYGYLKYSEWLEWEATGRYHPPNARTYFPSNLIWSDEMKNTIIKYNELFEKARTLRGQINELITGKKMHEAQQLWDSI